MSDHCWDALQSDGIEEQILECQMVRHTSTEGRPHVFESHILTEHFNVFFNNFNGKC